MTDIPKNFEVGVSAIESWMRNRNTVEFLGTWEKLYNQNQLQVCHSELAEESAVNNRLLDFARSDKRAFRFGKF